MIEENYRVEKLGLKTMSDLSYQRFKSEVGKPNMVADYPWSYDALLMREYFEGTGYKPAYLRTIDDDHESDKYEYICDALYGSLKGERC